jgi:hypothetical protein
MIRANHLLIVLTALGHIVSFASAMTFEIKGNGGNCSTCEWIAAEGEILPETPKVFEEFVGKIDVEVSLHGRYTIYLNSSGGNLGAGLKLGELIRKFQYSTEVGATIKDDYHWWQTKAGKCASACAFAFLGGESRTAKSGEIGVHQFYNEIAVKDPSAKLFDAIDLSHDQFISAILVDYVFRMGVDPRFITLSSLTPPDDVHYLTAEEAEDLRVNWEPRKFVPWSIEPYGNGVVAFTRTKDGTQTATFFCKKDQIPRLLISDKWISKEFENLKSAVDTLDGLDVFGTTVPKNNVIAKLASTAPAFEVTLGKFRPSQLISEEQMRISGLDHTGHAYWDYFNYWLPLANAQTTMTIALRNCL